MEKKGLDRNGLVFKTDSTSKYKKIQNIAKEFNTNRDNVSFIQNQFATEDTLGISRKKRMKKHKKDRSSSPKSKRKKDKTKRKKSLKKGRRTEVSLSINNLNKTSIADSSTQKLIEIDAITNEYQSKNNSTDAEKLLSDNSLKTYLSIENTLPLNMKKKYGHLRVGDKLSTTTCKKIKMPRTLTDSKYVPIIPKLSKQFDLSKEKQFLLGKDMIRSRSRSVDKSKNTSTLNYNSNYRKLSTDKTATKSIQRKSISYEKYNSQKRIFSHSYKKSLEKSSKQSYSRKKSQTPDILYNTVSSKKSYQPSNKEIEKQSKVLTVRQSSVQNNHRRYIDILHEVKKILKKDSIGKRKLKYILKKQPICIPAPSVNLRSSSEDELSVYESDKKYEDNEKQIEYNALKCIQSGLKAKACESLSKKYSSPMRSVTKSIDIPSTDTSLLNGKKSVTPVCNVKLQPVLKSRTPSPALPLIRDESILYQNMNMTEHKISLIKRVNQTKKSSDFSLKLPNDLKVIDESSKHLALENEFVDTLKIPTSSTNSSLLDKIKDSNINKNNVNFKENFSIHQLSCSSQSRSYSPSLLPPLGLSSASKPWSPIFLLSNNSNFLLKNDMALMKDEKKTLISSGQTSPSRTSSVLESLKSITPNVNTDLQNLPGNCEDRNRSMSLSGTSRSLSRSLSRNSRDEQKRSCSKSSTHTFVSSARQSCNSYSCTSRSTSSISNRSSRAASSNSSRSRSPSIPRRHGSPSFLDRRRITSARKRPVPYHRPTPSPLSSPSSIQSSNCSGWSTLNYRSSQSPSYSSPYIIS